MKKSIEQTLFSKLQYASKKERYALTNLFDYMNSTQDDYTYQFIPSSDNEAVCYDGTLLIKYKMTENFVGHFLIETKIRTENYEQLILEKKKFNNLKREKTKIDKRNIPQHHLGILYINFLPKKTIIFDLLVLEQNNLLPKTIRKSMNAITVNSSDIKEEKLVYLLDVNELGVKSKYVYTDDNYADDLLEESKENIKIVNEIKQTTYSIF